MKKEVSSSNLALRFYRSQGWDEMTLNQYVISYRPNKEAFILKEDWIGGIDCSYFIPNVGTKIDMKRLYENEVSKVHRAFDDYPNETDLEFMESKNW